MALTTNPPIPSKKPTNKQNALNFIKGDFLTSMIPSLPSITGGASGPALSEANSGDNLIEFGNAFNVAGGNGSSASSLGTKSSDNSMFLIGAIALIAIFALRK